MKSTAIPGMTGRHSIFDRFAGAVTRLAGTPWAFAVAVLSIVVWSATGPLFNFSGSWQMVVNTGTTIVTFLMVFLIQQSQNKDSLAVHIKLNELLAANELASNRVVAVEDLDEADLETLREFYCEIALSRKRKAASNVRIRSTMRRLRTRASITIAPMRQRNPRAERQRRNERDGSRGSAGTCRATSPEPFSKNPACIHRTDRRRRAHCGAVGVCAGIPNGSRCR